MGNKRGVSSCVIVFAKAPIAGLAKTRLIPALGAEGAAALQAALTQRAVATACSAGAANVELWCAGDMQHALFANLAATYPVSPHEQHGADLGERMFNAFDLVLARHQQAVIMGTDCPALTGAMLRSAFAALSDGYDAVIGPALDGGYVLLGLRRANRALFQDIVWGGASVLAATRERLKSQDLRVTELAPQSDIDTEADLQQLARWPDLAEWARPTP